MGPFGGRYGLCFFCFGRLRIRGLGAFLEGLMKA
jgi:hypothetical protein